MRTINLRAIAFVLSCLSIVATSGAIESESTPSEIKSADIQQRLERVEMDVALLASQGYTSLIAAETELAKTEAGLIELVGLAKRNNHAAQKLLESYMAESGENRIKMAWLYTTPPFYSSNFRDTDKALELIAPLAANITTSPWLLSLNAAIHASKDDYSRAIEMQSAAIARLQQWINEYSTISFPKPAVKPPFPPRNPTDAAKIYIDKMQRHLDAYKVKRICIEDLTMTTGGFNYNPSGWWQFNGIRSPDEIRKDLEKYQKEIVAQQNAKNTPSKLSPDK